MLYLRITFVTSRTVQQFSSPNGHEVEYSLCDFQKKLDEKKILSEGWMKLIHAIWNCMENKYEDFSAGLEPYANEDPHRVL